jgi:pilus assembly protein CpaD
MNISDRPAAPARRTVLKAPLASCASVLALALGLSACQTDPAATGAIGAAPDYRQRHPIVLAEAPRHLDVFVGGGYTRLDPRQRQDVYEFASEYFRTGKSGLTISIPQGVRYQRNVERTLAAVRHALAEHGVPPGAVRVQSYRPVDPALASPIRLSFDTLQAKVASQCSQWPDDLGGMTYPKDGWDNHAYWNLGCAYQANLAQQVDDPRDLVRARAMTPADTQRRLHDFEEMRKSLDPTTIYKKEATKADTSSGN